MQTLDEAAFIDGARNWLTGAIGLTEAGEWDALLDRYYDLDGMGRDEARDLIEANQQGHLELMRATLANEAGWVCLGFKLMALAPTFQRVDYEDDGIMFHVVDGVVRCHPNTDSLTRQRDRRPLTPETDSWSNRVGLHPQLISDLLRLGVDLEPCIDKQGVEALSAIDWGDVDLGSRGADDDEDEEADYGLLVYGWTPGRDEHEHQPEGFVRHGSVIGYGCDCYSFFGLVANTDDPTEPHIAIVDHEEEEEDPRLMPASLLFWRLVVQSGDD